MNAPLQIREPSAPVKPPCIGISDSGVGGLSVLRSLRALLPDAPLLYVADSGHAPYGERSDEYVLDRSRRIMDHLVAEGAVGLVIACNTATAIAVRELRSSRPGFPIVGVEPGLKPAAAATRNGRIGVMATPGTIASEKFRLLMQAQGNGVTITAQPCPGLARLIEDGDLNSSQLRAAIEERTASLRAAGVDTVVLGCTHYAFARHHIETAMGPGVQIIDTADAVARHAVNTLGPMVPLGSAAGSVRLQTTGNLNRLLAIASTWLPFVSTVESISAASDTPR